MQKTIAHYCKKCKQYGVVDVKEDVRIICPHCQHSWGEIKHLDDIFEHCPVCQCRQFYLTKDFNQFLGCLIMLIGIMLVPFTYGISLPVFAFIDWILHKRVASIINCYKCGCELRGFKNDRNFKPFLHHIGLKYDKSS